MITYKKVIDRYCPAKEHNVKVEIRRHDDGRFTEHCLCEACSENRCKTVRKITMKKGKGCSAAGMREEK